MSAPAFPELASTGSVIGDVLPDGTMRATADGVSSLIYPEFLDLERQDRVVTEAGVDVRLNSPSLQLNLFSTLLDIPSLEIARRINDDGAAIMRRYPGRVIGVPAVNPFDAAHLTELERAHAELGMRGVFIDTSWYVDAPWQNVYLDDPRTEPFWEHVERAGIPVFLHPPVLPIGHHAQNRYRLEEAVGRPADTALSVARLILSGLFDRHPDLRIHVAHMGGGLLPVMGRLDFTYRLGYGGLPVGEAAVCERKPSDYLRRNLWVDTMGFWAPHLREAIEVFGADRVMLGSDYGPLPISPAEHIDMVTALGLSRADEERILGRNAEALFELDLVAA
jgi:predicted TIM-barrel fold metal-dependent hydrolase